MIDDDARDNDTLAARFARAEREMHQVCQRLHSQEIFRAVAINSNAVPTDSDLVPLAPDVVPIDVDAVPVDLDVVPVARQPVAYDRKLVAHVLRLVPLGTSVVENAGNRATVVSFRSYAGFAQMPSLGPGLPNRVFSMRDGPELSQFD